MYSKIVMNCVILTLLQGCTGAAVMVQGQQASNNLYDSQRAYRKMNCSQLRAEYIKQDKQARNPLIAILPTVENADLKRGFISDEMEEKGCRLPS